MELAALMLVLSFGGIQAIHSYPRCGGSQAQPEGHIWNPNNGKIYWSHCAFQNPKSDPGGCGRSLGQDSSQYSLCDPGKLLTLEEGFEVDARIDLLDYITAYQCDTIRNVRQNFTFAVILLKYIKIPDLTKDVCVNFCDEIVPTLDPESREATADEIKIGIEQFAEQTRRRWNLGSCDNDVTMVYVEQYQYVTTSAGGRLQDALSESVLSSLHAKSLHYFKEGNVKDGVLFMLNSYKSQLVGFTTAHAFTIACVFSSLFISLAILSQLSLIQEISSYSKESHLTTVLNRTTTIVNQILGFVIYIVSLLWLVHCVLILITWINERAKPITILAPFLVCFVGAFLSWLIAPANNLLPSGVNITDGFV